MGKKIKVGKSRKDHYYELAKQQGFRARSAFKLVQIANKLDIFKNVTYVLDLCAAPGGWMQVARTQIPPIGHVFGVDLCNIKPIPGCTSIICDITIERCAKLLDEALTQQGVLDKLVDLVLHDGAPNVGSSWDKDAYIQNELVVHSMKLASKYLKKHGNFVTKVFRSAHYAKLISLFESLFERVQVFKPASSRTESAEIFFICINFYGTPKNSDQFFDCNRVFLDNETTHLDKFNKGLIPQQLVDSLKAGGLRSALKATNKVKATGYEQGDDYRKCTVTQLFHSTHPSELLVHSNAITFDLNDEFEKAIWYDASTTDEIKEFLKDLKLLSKAELQQIMKWRKKLLLNIIDQQKTKVENAETQAKSTLIDPEQIKEKIERDLKKAVAQDAKKYLKRLKEMKRKYKRLQQRYNEASKVFDGKVEDPILFSNGEESFKILANEPEYVDVNESYNSHGISNEGEVINFELDMQISSEDESDGSSGQSGMDDVDYIKRLEKELNEYHNKLKESKDYKKILKELKNKKTTRRAEVFASWAKELQDFTTQLDELNKENKMHDESDEDLYQSSDEINSNKFGYNIDNSTNIDVDGSESADEISSLPDSALPQIPLNEKKIRHLKRVKQLEKENKIAEKKRLKSNKALDNNPEVDDDTKIKTVKPTILSAGRPMPAAEIAEIQSIGLALNRLPSRIDTIESTYSRWNFEDNDDLPDWFKEEDQAARCPDIPLNANLAKQLQVKITEINQRPIRKVLEAKARRQNHLKTRLNKIKSEIAKVSNSSDYSEGSKNIAIAKLRKKSAHIVKPKITKQYVVANKSGKSKVAKPKTKTYNANTKAIPVDKRLKTDKRGIRKIVKKKKTNKSKSKKR